MADFIPFVDCCEAAIEFSLDGVPCVVTMGFRHTVSAAYSVSDLGVLATAIDVHYVTPLAARQEGVVVYRNIHLRDLDAVDGAVFDLPLAVPGGGLGTAVPNQVAMTVTFLTGVAGRSFRGRNYVAGLPAGTLADQRTWDTGETGAIQAIYEGFDGALPAADSEHVVLSRQALGNPRETGVATPVIGYRANPQVYTQRRRLT